MVTCTVYAMWFCGFAFFCAVIAAAFSTSYMVFAACCLVAIGMAFVALCDLGLWVEPLNCVMCIVDVDALCDTLVSLLSVIQVQNDSMVLCLALILCLALVLPSAEVGNLDDALCWHVVSFLHLSNGVLAGLFTYM